MGEASKFGEWGGVAVRVAAAGLGSAVAGPLGGAVGGFLADALGDSATELLKNSLEKFGDEAGKKLLDSGADSLAERLGKRKPEIESVYRETLRRSLQTIGGRRRWDGYQEWFSNWESCLGSSGDLGLPAVTPEQLQQPDALLRSTMECLAAQGTTKGKKSLSIQLTVQPMPDELYARLVGELPALLQENFRELLVEDENKLAWKQLELEFRDYQVKVLSKIEATVSRTEGKVDTANEQLGVLHQKLDELLRRQKISPEEAEAIRRDPSRWLENYQHALEDADIRQKELLEGGKFREYVTEIDKQIDQIEQQNKLLPKKYFEKGRGLELQFEWSKALGAYREAWKLERNPEYGFKCAYAAQHQNQFEEAIRTYEALRTLYTEPADVAKTLNNLANLYSGTQRMREAETAYAEALGIYRKLAEANPDAFLHCMAGTLNNLAGLYTDTQRMKEAETALVEALGTRRKLTGASADAYLPYEARTLNNLAILYGATRRMEEAETAYAEALAIQRKLAEVNPDTYLSCVATTLNNLAILYSVTQRMGKAETTYVEAQGIYRKLAGANPDAYLPYLAKTVNNLANLYRNTQRMGEAETAYAEALGVYRKLAGAKSDAYLPDVALTLNNLAIFYSTTQRMEEAETAYTETLKIYRKLAGANPDAYLSYVATSLNNLAILYSATQWTGKAEACCGEAEEILLPLWKANPTVHGDPMARIWCRRAVVGEMLNQPVEELCGLSRRAVAAAYDPEVKQRAQELVERYCG